MRILAAIFIALLALPALGADKMTTVTIDGAPYVRIQEVRLEKGARVVIMFDSGGTTVSSDKLPERFLESWGIRPADIAASRAEAERDAEELLAKAIRLGNFREVDGVVYDMRKPQPAFRYFSDALVLKVVEGGAMVDPTPYQPSTTMIFVRNLPRNLVDNEKVPQFRAKLSGDFTYINRFGFEQMIHAYDAGRICERNEIPDAIIKGGLASASLPLSARPKAGERAQRPPHVSPGGDALRAIGSGFFVTRDGYLLTNFHVVKDASKVEVKYKTNIFTARVVQVDSVNDLALLKVSGVDFNPLAISPKTAELGDAVFTIGFPNILMQGVEPKFTDGKISSLAGMQDDPSEYQISVPVQPGNSGGPLCDSDGQVVGIVVARLNDLAALRESGAMPQNVNYAVKAARALDLLHAVKGLDMLLVPAGGPVKPAKPVQAVEDAIAMIRIY